MGIVEGKVAIVTGGTRGIGYSIVREFLKNGAKVALAGSRKETVDKAIAQLAGLDVPCRQRDGHLPQSHQSR